eukprot:1831526-Karenia_brevis.AAC.1
MAQSPHFHQWRAKMWKIQDLTLPRVGVSIKPYIRLRVDPNTRSYRIRQTLPSPSWSLTSGTL